MGPRSILICDDDQGMRETIAAIRADGPPLDEPSYTRAQRLARRVTIRQLAQVSGPSRTLSAWRDTFDPPAA